MFYFWSKYLGTQFLGLGAQCLETNFCDIQVDICCTLNLSQVRTMYSLNLVLVLQSSMCLLKKIYLLLFIWKFTNNYFSSVTAEIYCKEEKKVIFLYVMSTCEWILEQQIFKSKRKEETQFIFQNLIIIITMSR